MTTADLDIENTLPSFVERDGKYVDEARLSDIAHRLSEKNKKDIKLNNIVLFNEIYQSIYEYKTLPGLGMDLVVPLINNTFFDVHNLRRYVEHLYACLRFLCISQAFDNKNEKVNYDAILSSLNSYSDSVFSWDSFSELVVQQTNIICPGYQDKEKDKVGASFQEWYNSLPNDAQIILSFYQKSPPPPDDPNEFIIPKLVAVDLLQHDINDHTTNMGSSLLLNAQFRSRPPLSFKIQGTTFSLEEIAKTIEKKYLHEKQKLTLAINQHIKLSRKSFLRLARRSNATIFRSGNPCFWGDPWENQPRHREHHYVEISNSLSLHEAILKFSDPADIYDLQRSLRNDKVFPLDTELDFLSKPENEGGSKFYEGNYNFHLNILLTRFIDHFRNNRLRMKAMVSIVGKREDIEISADQLEAMIDAGAINFRNNTATFSGTEILGIKVEKINWNHRDINIKSRPQTSLESLITKKIIENAILIYRENRARRTPTKLEFAETINEIGVNTKVWGKKKYKADSIARNIKNWTNEIKPELENIITNNKKPS